MFKNFLVSGDKHLGLTVGDIDRTPDIVKNYRAVINYLKKNKESIDAYIDLGDYYHHNSPTPDVYALGIDLLYEIDDIGVRWFLIKGNHCESKTKSCSLEPLKSIRWKNGEIIEDYTVVKNFMFIPHISKQLVAEHNKSIIEATKNSGLAKAKIAKTIEDLKSVQMYIDDRINETAGNHHQPFPSYVFTHLDSEGATYANTDYKLKETKLKIPQRLIDDERVKLILNGHIHQYQKQGKVICVGSIERGSFGEKNDEKCCILVNDEN